MMIIVFTLTVLGMFTIHIERKISLTEINWLFQILSSEISLIVKNIRLSVVCFERIYSYQKKWFIYWFCELVDICNTFNFCSDTFN